MCTRASLKLSFPWETRHTRTPPPQVHTHTFWGQFKNQFDKFNKLYWSLECSFVLWHIYTGCAGNWLSELSTRQRVASVMLSTYKSLPLYTLTWLVALGAHKVCITSIHAAENLSSFCIIKSWPLKSEPKGKGQLLTTIHCIKCTLVFSYSLPR